jgi:ABC-type transport system substrate-binding protein
MHDFCSSAASDYNYKWDTEDYYPFDLVKAKQLMAEAGVKSGTKIRLMNQNSSTANAGVSVIQAQLAEIGLVVELLSYDQALFNTYKYDSTKWDIIVDTKACYGYVVDVWTQNFNTEGYNNGTANFVHDDKLQKLLMEAVEIHDPASIDAYHYYFTDMAYGSGMFYNYSYFVAQSGITKIVYEGTRNVCLNASEFAPGYKTVVE